jgi:Xaa-Pro aminopeptidase
MSTAGRTTDPYAVDEAACRGRQRRLLDEMSRLEIELAVLSCRESVLWLTGALVRAPFEPVAAITADGHVTLVVPDRQLDAPAAADVRIGYAAKLHSTIRDDQREASSLALQLALQSVPKRVGVEFATFGPFLAFVAAGNQAPPLDVGPTIFQLRRRKDADELKMLCRANEANRAMYERAREIVRPGVNELDIYSELHAVAVRTLGEALTYFGQDFRSAARGGLPRERPAQAGELYILDLGVGFRGYYSDNARTLAVGGQPSAEQQQAWQAVMEVFPVVEATVRPGASCRALFETVQQQLDQHPPGKFLTHLGHGVGLHPHEGPHLNPNWDDTFAEGDFIAVEPGLYDDTLRYGVRLEQNYVVTADGAELLTPWPMELC